MKKLLFTLLLVTTTIITIACSNSTSHQEDLKQIETLEKVIKNHENLSSVTLHTITEENNITTKTKIVAKKDPLFLQVHGEKNDGTSYDSYYDNNFSYQSNEYQSKSSSLEWTKYKISDEEKYTALDYFSADSLKHIPLDLISMKETDTSYEIRYESTEYKYFATIDKNTHLLKYSETTETTNDKTKKIVNEYSNYNMEVDTNLPKEVASATENNN